VRKTEERVQIIKANSSNYKNLACKYDFCSIEIFSLLRQLKT
jgi:hypothetical protein